MDAEQVYAIKIHPHPGFQYSRVREHRRKLIHATESVHVRGPLRAVSRDNVCICIGMYVCIMCVL